MNTGTLNSEKYINFILNRFSPELTEGKIQYGYFRQDSAKALTTGNYMVTASDVFGDRVISECL
jgi:hypothetical protein